MESKPSFRLTASGDLVLLATTAAGALSSAFKAGRAPPFRAKKAQRVRSDALERVKAAGGDPDNGQVVLGESEVQFGQYRGQTFRWLLENDVGYTVHLLRSHEVSVLLC